MFSHKGELHFPIFFMYTETELGGVLEIEADYRDPHVTQLIEVDGWSIWPPVRYSYNTIDNSYQVTPSPPDGRHFLGTDGGGTDVFAKLLYGFRLSLFDLIAIPYITIY